MKQKQQFIYRLFLLVLFLLPGSAKVLSQSNANSDEFAVVDKIPQFPGNFQAYVRENMKYPAKALQDKVEGKVYVQAIIDKDGSITEVKILEDPGAGLGEEAARMIKEMPKWIPASHKGESIRMLIKFPITFSLLSWEKGQPEKQE